MAIVTDNFQDLIYNNSQVVVRDLAVNCILARAWKTVQKLAMKHEDTNLVSHALTQKENIEISIMSLWREDQSTFVSQAKLQNSDTWVDINKRTIQSLLPLLLDSIDITQYNALMADLSNSSMFNTTLPIPSVPLTEKEFEPSTPDDISWRGKVYCILNKNSHIHRPRVCAL